MINFSSTTLKATGALLATTILAALFAFQPAKPAYLIYDKDGKQVTYEEMVEAVGKSDILLFGEHHNNPICHWLQLQVTKDMFASKKAKMYMGAEMFEADGQLIINEYLAGKISEKSFMSEARLWPNYETDYKPLLEYAKENTIPFVATNIPRRYASVVYREGLEGLNNLGKEAKGYIAPLPIKVDLELGCYKSMMEMAQGHGGENLPKAQAIKDATMAHFISRFWKKGLFFLHFQGAHHSDNHEAIAWYLKEYTPKAKVMTISTVSQDDINVLSDDNKNLGDFIICVPSDMTTTY